MDWFLMERSGSGLVDMVESRLWGTKGSVMVVSKKMNRISGRSLVQPQHHDVPMVCGR